MTQAIQRYTPQESIQLQTVSQELFKSGMFPNAKSPAGVFAVVEYGFEMGLPPVTALQNISVISGKLTLTAGLMLSLAVRSGVAYQVTENTEVRCRINFTRTMNGQPVKYASSFTIEEARKAGLVKPGSAWEKYPADMLFNRTVARGVRKIAPDIVSGAYTPDEVESFTAPEIQPPENGNGKSSPQNMPADSSAPQKIETEEVFEAEVVSTTIQPEDPLPVTLPAVHPDEAMECSKISREIWTLVGAHDINLDEVKAQIVKISQGRTESSKELTLHEMIQLRDYVKTLVPVEA